MEKRRRNSFEKLERILQLSGASLSVFQKFMGLTYSQAVSAAKAAQADVNSEFGFLAKNAVHLQNLPSNHFDAHILSKAGAEQVMIDRIYQFYLMKFFHECTDKQFSKYLTIEGWEIAQRHVEAGRGVLFLNSHFGPGQVTQIVLSRMGLKLTSLGARDFYRTLELKNLNVKVLPLTDSFNAQLVAQGCSVLNQKEILHMTGDGFAGESGKKVKFIGKQRSFPNGFAYMVERTESVCLPVFVSISATGHITMKIQAAIKPNPQIGDRQLRLEKMTSRYVNLLRRAWRSDPRNIPPLTIKKYLELPVWGGHQKIERA